MNDITIKIIENGYEVITPEEITGENDYVSEVDKITAFTFENDESDYSKSHCEAMQDLLYKVMSELAFYNSKHNPYRINIEIEEQKQD